MMMMVMVVVVVVVVVVIVVVVVKRLVDGALEPEWEGKEMRPCRRACHCSALGDDKIVFRLRPAIRPLSEPFSTK